MTYSIELDNLSIGFHGVPLLSGLSLSVRPGERVTLTGLSGSGKSTLVRCIMGFTPVTSGTITILGEELTAGSVWHLRGKMAYVAQEPALGDGSVRDALRRPFTYRINHSLSYDEKESSQLFDQFMLPAALMEKDITTLSGGEKQRIALVIALSLHRPILLLDEAASALDSASKQAVRDYLCGRDNLTILSISHDVRDFSLSENVMDIARFSKGVGT